MTEENYEDRLSVIVDTCRKKMHLAQWDSVDSRGRDRDDWLQEMRLKLWQVTTNHPDYAPPQVYAALWNHARDMQRMTRTLEGQHRSSLSVDALGDMGVEFVDESQRTVHEMEIKADLKRINDSLDDSHLQILLDATHMTREVQARKNKMPISTLQNKLKRVRAHAKEVINATEKTRGPKRLDRGPEDQEHRVLRCEQRADIIGMREGMPSSGLVLASDVDSNASGCEERSLWRETHTGRNGERAGDKSSNRNSVGSHRGRAKTREKPSGDMGGDRTVQRGAAERRSTSRGAKRIRRRAGTRTPAQRRAERESTLNRERQRRIVGYRPPSSVPFRNQEEKFRCILGAHQQADIDQRGVFASGAGENNNSGIQGGDLGTYGSATGELPSDRTEGAFTDSGIVGRSSPPSDQKTLELVRPKVLESVGQKHAYIQTREFDFQLATRALEQNSPHTIVQDLPALANMLNMLQNADKIAYDTETSGTQWFLGDRICGMSFTVKVDFTYLSWYVPIRHFTNEVQLAADVVLDAIRPILADPTKTIICHNMPFDWHMSEQDNIHFKGTIRDTMGEGHLHDENLPLALKDRASTMLNDPRAHEFEKILGAEVRRRAKDAGMKITEYKNAFGYSHIPVRLCGIYACFDTEFTYRLADFYDEKGTTSTYKKTLDLEMDLLPAVCRMETKGMPIDIPYLKKVQVRTEEAMWALEPSIYEGLGVEFNIASDAELRAVLVGRCGLRLRKRTRSGAASVEAEVLQSLVPECPALDLVLKYRAASKIHSTYTQSILDKVDKDGIIHGSFLPFGTNTGRFSSKNPNLQNFASDSNSRAVEWTGLTLEKGGIDPFSVKRAFIPHTREGRPQMRFFYDYSQIELRVLAFYTQDPTMLSVYLADEDIHARTQKEVFNSTDKADRRLAKIINFGLVYGITASGFARQAGIEREKAQKFMDVFFERFPRIAPFRQELWDEGRSHGNAFVNIFGRPRRIPQLSDSDEFTRGGAERRFIGSLIQGSAAHLTKQAIVRVDRWIEEEGLPIDLVSTVHDEIQLDMEAEIGQYASYNIKSMMEDCPELAPILAKTDIEATATNWAEKKDYELT